MTGSIKQEQQQCLHEVYSIALETNNKLFNKYINMKKMKSLCNINTLLSDRVDGHKGRGFQFLIGLRWLEKASLRK